MHVNAEISCIEGIQVFTDKQPPPLPGVFEWTEYEQAMIRGSYLVCCVKSHGLRMRPQPWHVSTVPLMCVSRMSTERGGGRAAG